MAHVATITIDSTLVDSDLTDFPVYVDLSDLPSTGFWDTVANGGGDIRVFLSDDSTELPREVVSCDTATETGELHFLLDYLSSSSDTDIHIYADGTSSDYATGATYGRDAVWAGYEFVSHDGGGLDSSGSVTTTANGGVSAGAATGKVGAATTFDGSDDYFSTTSFYPQTGAGDRSVSAWFKSSSSANQSITHWGNQVTGANGNRWDVRIDGDNGDVLRTEIAGGYERATTDVVDGTWHFLGSVFSGTNITSVISYVDGANDGTGASASKTVSTGSSESLSIGARYASPVYQLFVAGELDEVRISQTAFSADWISTEYNNQSSPSTFYSASAAGGGSVSLTLNESNQSQTIGEPALIQNHVLSCDSMTQGQSIESPQLIQAHVIAVNAMAQGQSFSEPGLVQQNALDTLSAAQTQIVTEPPLVQHHALSTTGIDQPQSSSEPSLTQHNALSVTASDQSQTIDQPPLSSNDNISPNECDQGQIIAEPGLTQHYILTTDSVTQAVTLEAALLSVVGSLTVSNASQGQAFDEPVLVQHHVLSVSDESQAQFSGAVSFAQNYVLSVDEVVQAQSFGDVTLTEQALLSLDSLEQVQGSAQITLTEHAVLAVSELSQAQIIDVVLNGGIVVEKVDGFVTIYSAYSGELSLGAGHSGSVTIH